MTPELSIIALNVIIIVLSYLMIYPKVVGGDLNKLLLNDLIASVMAIVVAGSVYWGSNVAFDTLVTTCNWFWFTLLTYTLLEIPVMLWYLKKYKISLK